MRHNTSLPLGQLMRVIIDDRGRIWNASSTELRHHFSVTGSENDVERRLVNLVGCIGWRVDRLIARITINPRIASPIALARLFYLLFDSGISRFAIHSTPTGIYRMAPSAQEAANAIKEMLAQSKISETIQYETRNLDVNLIDEASQFGVLLQRRTQTRDVFSFELYHQILDNELNGRWLIVEPQGCGADMRILSCGTGFGIPTADFCRQLPGAFLSSLPDKRYASWVAKSYERASQLDQPIFQSVRSVAYWPDKGYVEAEYARLVVPFLLENGLRAILSTSRRFGFRQLRNVAVA